MDGLLLLSRSLWVGRSCLAFPVWTEAPVSAVFSCLLVVLSSSLVSWADSECSLYIVYSRQRNLHSRQETEHITDTVTDLSHDIRHSDSIEDGLYILHGRYHPPCSL